ncbi:MAG: hypothetical protein K2Q15_08210, partial [Burkholderiales bacterium]|nr:hypothetical protein [Burkholderiales bacterium]
GTTLSPEPPPPPPQAAKLSTPNKHDKVAFIQPAPYSDPNVSQQNCAPLYHSKQTIARQGIIGGSGMGGGIKLALCRFSYHHGHSQALLTWLRRMLVGEQTAEYVLVQTSIN